MTHPLTLAAEARHAQTRQAAMEKALADMGVVPSSHLILIVKKPVSEPVDRDARGWVPSKPGDEPPF